MQPHDRRGQAGVWTHILRIISLQLTGQRERPAERTEQINEGVISFHVSELNKTADGWTNEGEDKQ